MKKCLPIIVVLMMAAAANAAIVEDFTNYPVTLSDTVTNLVVNDMWVTVSGDKLGQPGVQNDWTNAQIIIALSAGQCYNDTMFGDNVEPMTNLVIAFPDLAYDTYLADPQGRPEVAYFPSAPAGTENAPSTAVNASWYDDPNFPDGNGTFRIAQLTFTPDAMGTVEGIVFDSDSSGEGVLIPLGKWVVDEGAIVPEPVTLALLASGGICVLLRKRR